MEWNNTLLDVVSARYSSLVDSEESHVVFESNLPLSLEQTCLLLIDIKTQLLFFIERGALIKKFQISTATNGAGCRENSGCTPLGWHKVAAKIGGDQPLGTVFKGRCVAGLAESLNSIRDDDLITSRILWLAGLQPGVNAGGSVDSYSRYIYIHGTAQEHLIGLPVSHGCIRMRNSDIAELFDWVDEKTIVFVGHNLVEN